MMVENRSRLFISLGALVLLVGLLFPIAAATSTPLEITLTWDPSPDPDVVGYGIYFKTAGDRAFKFLDDVYVDELEDPDTPMVTLTELDDGTTYYFAVTAFSEDGHESSFSSKVCVQIDGAAVIECSSEEDDDNNGNDGSGCFFAASSG
jgi:fibronectin type 3 domain-containing protein